MVSKAIREASGETKMELTPMIDVTFLLLIFFLCSIKFKILEGKLQTYLPKDVGVNTTPQQEMLDKIDVTIHRLLTRDKLNLEDTETFRAWKTKGWTFDEIQVTLGGEKMRDLEQLRTRLKKMREQQPFTPTSPDDDDPLKMNLEAMKGTIYEDVVKVVDVALDAGFTSITFRGIEMDA